MSREKRSFFFKTRDWEIVKKIGKKETRVFTLFNLIKFIEMD